MSSESARIAGNSKTYEFGEFRLDAKNLLLMRNSEVVSLPPKACEVMLALVESSGRVVPKQEILEKVWSDTFVEEANLTHHISALRKALGEDKNSRRFIETIPRRGYRFVAPVKEIEIGELTVSERTRTRFVEEEEITGKPKEIIKAGILPQAAAQELPQPGKNFLSKPTAVFLSIGLLAVLCTAIFAWFVSRPNANSEQIRKPMTVSRITNSGNVGAVSISPDGKFVAYLQNYTDGVGTVYIRQTDTNIENRLVTYEKGEFGMTAFSPDGAFVFYVARYESQPDFALYRVPVTGGSPVRLIDKLDARHFALSPDGAEIVIVRYGEKENALVAIRLDRSGAERVLATSHLQEKAFQSGGAWSPDGQKIVLPVKFAAATNNYSQLVTNVMELNLTTGALRNFTEETWTDFGIMRWMPDGSGVVVIGTRPQLRNQIYFIANPSGEVSRITNDTSGYGNYGLGITKDGSKLVADVWESEGRIWKLDADGNMKTAVPLPSGNTTGASGLTTLPDGRIIFGARTDLAFDLWMTSETESEARPLTSDAFHDSQAVANPDGSFIVFVSDRAGAGTKHLFRINPDGSRIEQITFGEGWEDAPDISPDGKWIIYYSESYVAGEANLTRTIRKIPIGGGSPVVLKENCFMPAFSPDGQKFSCIAPFDNYHGRIIVAGANDGQIIKTFDVDFYYHMYLPVRWTPDGTGLVFRNVLNQTANLRKQNLSGGAPVQLTDFKSESIFNFTFSRDGKHLLVARGNVVVNVVIFKNFR